jgi:GAF domain-containing protein
VVGDPKIRFYAGCSLEVKGLKLGTFCVFDKKPRAFTAEDRQLLKDLAHLAEQELMVSETIAPATV